jgi:aspartyl-tRNA(Asn)/glutamyl-tRNA(Gln) amidotransferase subunit C
MSGEPIGGVDLATVERLAALAELEIDASEKAALVADLNRILGHVAELAELDLEGVAPTSHLDFASASRGLRPDVPKPELDRELVLAQAPKVDGHGFVVPTFVDEG